MKKKFGLLLLIVVTCVSISCSDDDPKLSINTSSASLYSGDIHMITTDGTNVSFKSRNPYIASVNEATGKVTALTIGSTIIDIIADQGHAELFVQVKAKYNTYVEPCVDFFTSKSSIISKLGIPDSETDGGIIYIYPDNEKHFADMYMFENNKLVGSCVLIHQDYAVEAMNFLGERYIPAGTDDGIYVFANGISMESVTMTVSFTKMSGYKLYMVMYMPYSYSTRCIFENICYEKIILPKEFDEYSE